MLEWFGHWNGLVKGVEQVIGDAPWVSFCCESKRYT